MPDIAMCRGEGCQQAEKCFRHMATPDTYWQSWFSETPKKNAEGKCYQYISLERHQHFVEGDRR